LVNAIVTDAVTVHVKDVARAAIRHSVPNDLITQAHIESWVVGENVPIQGEEGRRRNELIRAGEVDELRVPVRIVAGIQTDCIETATGGRGATGRRRRAVLLPWATMATGVIALQRGSILTR